MAGSGRCLYSGRARRPRRSPHDPGDALIKAPTHPGPGDTATGGTEEPSAPEPVSRRLRWNRTETVAVLALLVLAGLLRFVRLGEPPSIMFDETYYARDACRYLGMTAEACGVPEKIVMKYLPDGGTLDTIEQSYVHPPLGKWLIAGGIALFGFDPFGWRFAAALAGTALVGVVYLLARSLFQRRLTAGLAGLLTAAEFLLIVHSRTALLDIFLAFFVTLGFLFLAKDREQVMLLRDPDGLPRGESRRRWLRLAAGVAFGAAMAVKWSGYLALLCGAALAIGWTVRRVINGRGHAREFAGVGLSMILVPFVVYALPWIPWLAERGFDLGEWLRHHDHMLDYHATLDTVKENGEPIHPYMSRAWSWLLLLRPVAYYWQGDPSCCEEIIGIGNPFIFWASLLVIPYLAIAWLRGRRWQAGAVLLPILFQFLPWLVVSRPLFLFYMTPVTPFLALGLVFPVRDLIESRAPRALSVAGAAVVVLVAVGMFAFFLPVLVGERITYEAWDARMWLDSWV